MGADVSVASAVHPFALMRSVDGHGVLAAHAHDLEAIFA
jgi:hypothetical protein